MKSTNHRTSRRGRNTQFFEPLESRRLLSVSIAAALSNGQLTLTSDHNNDSVIVDQAGLSAGQFRVSSGDGVTRVNNQTAAVVYSGVKSLVINTSTGNDTITIQNAVFSSGVQINGTSGNQIVTVNNVQMGGNFSLTGNGAQNSTLIEGSTVNGGVTLSTGAGYSSQCGCCWNDPHFSSADDVFTLTGSIVQNNVSIANASGATTTTLNADAINGNVTVNNGNNSFGCSNYNQGCGHTGAGFSNAGDLFTMNGSAVNQNVTVNNASDGNNTVITGGSSIGGNLTVQNDVVSSSNCYGFQSCGGSNLANASDAFTIDGSAVNGNLTLANVSDGASATITDGASIGGGVSVNNGVGSYGQGCTQWGGGTANPSTGDYLLLSNSAVTNGIVLVNGSTYNSTDVETSSIGLGLNVSDGLNLDHTCYQSCYHGGCGEDGYEGEGQCGSNNCGSNNCGSNCGSQSGPNTNDLFTMNGSAVGTDVAVANASGYTSTIFEASAIGGNVTILDQNGIAYFDMDATIVGNNLIFSAGSGTTSVIVTSSFIVNNATITVTPSATIVISVAEVGGTLTT